MRFHKLDLNVLVILNLLLQGKNVKETAQFLHLTQPAVSNALARLREHFDDPLFVATGRRMEPTPFAQTLTEPVKDAIEDIERIICARASFDPRTVRRTFTIVCSDYVYTVFMTRLVRRIAEVAPHVVLQVVLLSESVISLLEEGAADFLIAPAGVVSPDHPSLALFSDTYSCVAWTGNSVIGDRLTREQYVAADHVDTMLGMSPQVNFGECDEPCGQLPLRSAVRAPSFSAMVETLIGTNYLASVQTRLALALSERLPLRVMDLPISRPGVAERLQWHKNKDKDAGAIWLRGLMVSVAAAQP